MRRVGAGRMAREVILRGGSGVGRGAETAEAEEGLREDRRQRQRFGRVGAKSESPSPSIAESPPSANEGEKEDEKEEEAGSSRSSSATEAPTEDSSVARSNST